MCSYPMANPVAAELPSGRQARQMLVYGLVGLGFAALALLLLQALLGHRLAQQRQQQLGTELSAKLLLAEVALERFSPASLAQIGGLQLAVGPWPEPGARLAAAGGSSRAVAPGFAWADPRLRRQAGELRGQFCRRLGRCPLVLPAQRGPRGVWIELVSPLESVWLFAPLPPLAGWPPDPLMLSLALGSGGIGAGLLFLSLEVQRPLRRLEQALAELNLDAQVAAPLALGGSGAVRALTVRFNAMVERLERAGRDRATMLAGIAHDLRAPLTRLRLRLDLATAQPLAEPERRRSAADLDALERITRQFLLFAGAERAEPPLWVPLHQLVAEAAAVVGSLPLELDLQPLERRVRPTALTRAVTNLLENAISHGAPPLRIVLRGNADGFVLEVWDGGKGIAAGDWQTALEPFQRLDPARGGQGHCGLGLAIADRIARDHGGGLRRLVGPGGFGVALAGRGWA